MKIKPFLNQMNPVLDEISEAKSNFVKVNSELEALDAKYQRGELEYKEYIKNCNSILSGKTREQISENYNYYLASLKKKIVELNSKLFKTVFNDKSYNDLLLEREAKKSISGISLPDFESLDISLVEMPIEHFEIKEVKKIKPLKIELAPPIPESKEKLAVPLPVKLTFFQRINYAFTAKKKPWIAASEKEGVFFNGFFTKEFLEYLFNGKEKEEIFTQTKVLPSILTYEETAQDREITGGKTEILDPYLLEKEIKEIKALISRKRPEVYKASTLGYLANISVRKITIYFIEQYPEFFKTLYRDIRYANIRFLANTYINIVFFLTFIASIISFPLFTLVYSLQGNTFFGVIFKTFLTTLFFGGFVFLGGVYYPTMKAKSRKRSINTNLPFAIDHMSSVIASGVSPATMFKLISNSREYGEISVEIDKVSNYVDFFGYDVLTSLKAVSLTTPSDDFKEFIDGFVSTIETGGDLKNYLSQKSSEALLNYRLERQKYVEALSTYSDIYTGVLIAAPLFFVIALSLVSVIGGDIGGLSVTSIISFGTYVAIPILNLLFLIFLEASQPEI